MLSDALYSLKNFLLNEFHDSKFVHLYAQVANYFADSFSKSHIINHSTNPFPYINLPFRTSFSFRINQLCEFFCNSKTILFTKKIVNKTTSINPLGLNYYTYFSLACGILFRLLLLNYSFPELLTAVFFSFIGVICFTRNVFWGSFTGYTNTHKANLVSSVFCIISFSSGGVPLLCLFLIAHLIRFVYRNLEQSLLIYIAVLPLLSTKILIVLNLIILGLYMFRKISEKRFPAGYNWIMCGGYILYLWGIINSYDKFSSLTNAAVYITFMTMFFPFTDCFKSVSRFKLILKSFSVSSVICSIYGIYQYIFSSNLNIWQDPEKFSDLTGRIVSFFENPNVYGEYLIFAIMINLVNFLSSASGKVKITYLVVLFLSVVNMLLTYSRGCWIGLITAIFVFLFMRYQKIFIGGLLLSFSSVAFLPQDIFTRLLSIGNLSDTSTSYRLYIWEGTLKMLRDYWLTGVGIGTSAFNKIYPQYMLSAIDAPHPHSLYLLILSETGILGLLFFFASVAFLLKLLFNASVKNKGSGIYPAALLSALAGFLIQGIFDNVWYNYRVFLIFWIIISLSVCSVSLGKE